MKSTNSLIIIAKHPEKATVKTRLSAVMSDEERLQLYTFLLKSSLQRLGAIRDVDTFIAFAPRAREDYFATFGLKLLPLPEGDLGERMYHAFQEVFHRGYTKAALVGVDIPELSGDIVLKAFDILSEYDVVFGPARDGGYYLIGMKKPIAELFEGIPWSSEKTLEKSIEKVQQMNYTFGLTEMLSDIDTMEDVRNAGFYYPKQ
jgi:rSAM/selenodomain-associated transferase 1